MLTLTSTGFAFEADSQPTTQGYITFSTNAQSDYPEEDNMYTETEDHGRKYATHRIRQIYHKRYEDLQDKFHFWEKKPSSLKELKEWLDKKEYTIVDHGLKEDTDFSENWSNWKSYFRWGPAFDEKGYEEALKSLDAQETAAQDVIAVCENEDKRLQAIKDFEHSTTQAK